MKKFVSNLILLVFLLFLIDKVFYFVMLKLPGLQYDRRLEFLIEDQLSADIFIIGSSRAARDVDACTLAKLTQRSCYNLGYPGSNIEFHLFLLKQLAKNTNLPKSILLVMDDSMELIENESINFRYDKLYPIVKYDFINEMICTQYKKNRLLEKLFITYRIKENFPVNFFIQKPSELEMIDAYGSALLDMKGSGWLEMEYELNNEYFSQDESSKLYKNFISFVEICQVNNIELVLVFPPNFKQINQKFVDRIQTVSGSQIKSYIYNEFRLEYKDRNYFYNKGHLNKKGAEIFTKELSTFLIQ